VSPLLVLGLLASTQLIDGITAVLAIRYMGLPPGSEVNPIAGYFMESSDLGLIVVKMLVVLLASALIIFGQRKRPSMAKKVLILGVALGLIGAASNVLAMAMYVQVG
jgi:hypothetical protein